MLLRQDKKAGKSEMDGDGYRDKTEMLEEMEKTWERTGMPRHRVWLKYIVS